MNRGGKLQGIGIRLNAPEQIKKYFASQPEPKRSDMQELHRIILQVMPTCKLWFKASVSGYCIRFKTIKDINIDTLETAIRYGIGASS